MPQRTVRSAKRFNRFPTGECPEVLTCAHLRVCRRRDRSEIAGGADREGYGEHQRAHRGNAAADRGSGQRHSDDRANQRPSHHSRIHDFLCCCGTNRGNVIDLEESSRCGRLDRRTFRRGGRPCSCGAPHEDGRGACAGGIRRSTTAADKFDRLVDVFLERVKTA